MLTYLSTPVSNARSCFLFSQHISWPNKQIAVEWVGKLKHQVKECAAINTHICASESYLKLD